MRCAILFLLFLSFSCDAAQFGEYQYTKYMAISQQLQNQRRNAILRQRRYNTSPTRNIRFPSSSNPYPNITKTQNQVPLSARQRYSYKYYESL